MNGRDSIASAEGKLYTTDVVVDIMWNQGNPSSYAIAVASSIGQYYYLQSEGIT